MRYWLQKLEAMAAAVAFAEEGEWRTARSILNEPKKRIVSEETDRVKQPRRRGREHPYRV